MYHNIGVPPLGARMKGLYVLPSMFCFQLWFLKKAGFRVVTISEMLDCRDNNERLATLTFDDGYEDFYKNALPLLEQYGYPATVFVVSSLIGRSNLWDTARYGGVSEPLMDLEQLREIRARGIEIGSHSKTHADLTKLDTGSLTEEIEGSKRQLEGLLGPPIDLFCYPFGGYTPQAIEVVRKAGYRAALSTKRGSFRVGDNPFEIRRIPVRLNTHPILFAYKVLSNYEDRRGRKGEA